MSYIVYVLEVQSEGYVSEVFHNGISVFSEPFGGKRFLQTKINPSLIEGTNEMLIDLALPPPPPRDAPPLPSRKIFKMRAFRAEWGKEGPDEALAEYEYTGDPELSDDARARVAKLPFDAGAAHGRWAWQDATPFSPADRDAFVGLVVDAHAALSAKDAAGFSALTKTKNDELARAVDTPVDELEADETAYLTGFFQSPDWQVAPVNPGKLVLKPSADGRLVQITDAVGRPPLRGFGSGKPFAMSVTASHLKSGFRIVR